MSKAKLLYILSSALMLTSLASCGRGGSAGKQSVTTAQYADAFTVSNVFSSDMIVQRGENIRVWGWSDESQNGRRISGEFMGMTADTVISDGKWELVFPPIEDPVADTGHNMRIFTDRTETVFSDVLVGDVYIVAGQSNCAYTLETHLAYAGIAQEGDHDSPDYSLPIRLHYNSLTQTDGYPRRGTAEVCEQVMSGEKWRRADSFENIRNFSAIGYLTAAELVWLSGGSVPVGMIEIDGNGQPLGAFMSNQVADKMKTDAYDPATDRYVTTGVNADAGRYLYNHYMYPFERFPIAGLIWYQGESDFSVENAFRYPSCYEELIRYMRSTHNLVNPDFPVFYIEFPATFQRPSDFPADSVWAYMDLGLIRSVMGTIQRELDNCYQVVSTGLFSDRTFWNSLHPNIKGPQALRTARLIASVNGIGEPMDEAAGPIAEKISLSDDGKTAVITYRNVGTGLAVSTGGTDVLGFTLCNSSGIPDVSLTFTAQITGKDTVTVKSDTVINGIAYNGISDMIFNTDLNLIGGTGMPAGATYFDCRS